MVDGPVTLRFYPEALAKQTFLKGHQGQGWGWGRVSTHAHITLMIVPQTDLESFLVVLTTAAKLSDVDVSAEEKQQKRNTQTHKIKLR